MELREATITFTYPSGGSVNYQIQLVNYKEPYRYFKWLFTQLVDDNPYLSYQAENDEELLLLFAKQSIGATQININYHDKEIKNSWDDIEDPIERERVKDFEEYGFALAAELKNHKKYRRERSTKKPNK